MKLGVYIHVPFCRKKCDYCSFYSVPVDPASSAGRAGLRAYCERVGQEARLRLGGLNGYEIDTVYFGGGTPSLLEPVRVAGILKTLREIARVDADAEVTVEINPEDCFADNLHAFREAGITRAVLGVQTRDLLLHELIGRSSSVADDELLDAFFSVPGIIPCADIIAGIPGQREDGLIADLDSLCSRRARHLSVYLLTIEKSTPLSRRVTYTRNLEETQRGLFEATIGYLTSRGLVHYEISNFAVPGFESRHNMKYWKFLPYLGLGAGAHSFIRNKRTMCAMSAEEYLGGDEFRFDEDRRTPNAAAVEYLLTGLRLLEGVSLAEMEQATGVAISAGLLSRIDSLAEKGLVSVARKGGDRIVALSGEGIFQADGVIYAIAEEYL